MRFEAGQYVRAAYDFPTSHPGEISLQAGDVVLLIGVVDQSWLRGRLPLTGQEGNFPATYVEPIPVPSVPVGQKVFMALDDFPGQESGDLSLSRGDVVTGLEAVDDCWWRGKCGPLRGIFPLTLVVELPSASSSLAPTGRQLHHPSHPAPGGPAQEEEGLARALVDTTPQLGGELGLVAGDIVVIKEVIDADWYLGECKGKRGLVPSFCVELLTDAPLPGSSSASSAGHSDGDHGQSGHLGQASESSVGDGGCRRRQNSLMDYVYTSTDQGDEVVSPSYYTSENTRSHDAEITPYARTLYQFVAQNANELSFEANEIVTLLQHVDADWTEGELDGKVGLFPTSFVEIIVDCPHKNSDNAVPPSIKVSKESSAVEPPVQSSNVVTDNVGVKTSDKSSEKLGLVLHNFHAAMDGDLTVSEGDTIVIMEFLDSNWVRGRDENGSVGLVPLNHIEVIDECPVRSQSSLSETSSLNGTESPSSTSPQVPKSSSWSDFNDNRVKPFNLETAAPKHASEQRGTCKPSGQDISISQNQKPPRNSPQQESMTSTKVSSTEGEKKPSLQPKPMIKPKLAPKPILKGKPTSLPPKPSLQSVASRRAQPGDSAAEKKLKSPALTSLDTLISVELRKSKEKAENRSRSSSSLSSGSRDSQELAMAAESVKYTKKEPMHETITADSPLAPEKPPPSPVSSVSARSEVEDEVTCKDVIPPPNKVPLPEIPKRVSFHEASKASRRPRPKSEVVQGTLLAHPGEATPPGMKPSGFVNDAYSFDPDELLVNTEGPHQTTAPPARPLPLPTLTHSRSVGSLGEQEEGPKKSAPPRPMGPRIAAAPSKVPLTPAPVSQPLPSRPAPPAPLAPQTSVQPPSQPASGGMGRVPSRPAPPRPTSVLPPRRPPPRPKSQPQSSDLMTFISDSHQDSDAPLTRRTSIFYVPLPEDPEDSSSPNEEVIMDLRRRIEEVKKDLQKFEASREALRQKLQQAGEEDREDVEEDLADVEANILGLTEELCRLQESLCQVSPEDERLEQQRQHRQRAEEMARQQQLEEKKKRREKREKVIQELLATEKDYLFNLQLCLTTFLATPDKPALLDVDKVLGNMEEIAEVSQRLLTCLENALNGKEFQEQIVGANFLTLAEDMKNTYAPYCRNHDEVITLMEKYKMMPEMREYFGKLVEKMRQQTNVFDLEAQLIKPVQRVLKYPLLLNELLKATEDDHPDKVEIMRAISAITDVAGAINEYKRRKDLVYKYKRESDATFSEKIAKFNMHSIKKKSSRIRGRLSTGLGISLMTRDENFDREEEKFHTVEKATKIFLRNVQTYMEQLHEALAAQESLAAGIAEFYENKATPDVLRYKKIQIELGNTLLQQFKETADELVVTPLTKLITLLQGPTHVMQKRFDKLLDFDSLSRKAKDPDRAPEVQKVKADYEAMNAQLLDELPRLYQLATSLLTTCVGVFTQAQRNFTDAALKEMYQGMQLPLLVDSSDRLVDVFNVKHTAIFDQLSQLSFIPRGFNPRVDATRQDRQSKRQSLDSGNASQVEQDETQQANLREKYPGQLYRVKEKYNTGEEMELSVSAGQLVAVVKEGDPMGNKERWYVDLGGVTGFIPRRILVPDSTYVVSGGPSPSLAFAAPPGPGRTASPSLIGAPHAPGSLHPPLAPQPAQAADALEEELDDIAADPSLGAPDVPENVEAPEYYQALYNFQSRVPAEMSLVEGQVVKVLEKRDEDGNTEWWHVDIDGHLGYAPANYLQKLT